MRPSRLKEARHIEAQKAWQKTKLQRELEGWTPRKGGKIADRTRERGFVHSSKMTAKKKNIAFDLTVDDIIIPEFCPVLGVKIDRNGKRVYNSPSIDRIYPDKGYIKGNVRIISWRANLLKNNMTLEEARLVYEDIRKIYEQVD